MWNGVTTCHNKDRHHTTYTGKNKRKCIAQGTTVKEIKHKTICECTVCTIFSFQTKFSSRTSGLRTNVQSVFSSRHQVVFTIIIIMIMWSYVNNIAGKSSSRVREVEKGNSSGTREFRGENAFGRETLCFFGKCGCGSWGRQRRVSVSAVAALDVDKNRTTL